MAIPGAGDLATRFASLSESCGHFRDSMGQLDKPFQGMQSQVNALGKELNDFYTVQARGERAFANMGIATTKYNETITTLSKNTNIARQDLQKMFETVEVGLVGLRNLGQMTTLIENINKIGITADETSRMLGNLAKAQQTSVTLFDRLASGGSLTMSERLKFDPQTVRDADAFTMTLQKIADAGGKPLPLSSNQQFMKTIQESDKALKDFMLDMKIAFAPLIKEFAVVLKNATEAFKPLISAFATLSSMKGFTTFAVGALMVKGAIAATIGMTTVLGSLTTAFRGNAAAAELNAAALQKQALRAQQAKLAMVGLSLVGAGLALGGGAVGGSAGEGMAEAGTGMMTGAMMGSFFTPVLGPLGPIIGGLVGASYGFLQGTQQFERTVKEQEAAGKAAQEEAARRKAYNENENKEIGGLEWKATTGSLTSNDVFASIVRRNEFEQKQIQAQISSLDPEKDAQKIKDLNLSLKDLQEANSSLAKDGTQSRAVQQQMVQVTEKQIKIQENLAKALSDLSKSFGSLSKQWLEWLNAPMAAQEAQQGISAARGAYKSAYMQMPAQETRIAGAEKDVAGAMEKYNSVFSNPNSTEGEKSAASSGLTAQRESLANMQKAYNEMKTSAFEALKTINEQMDAIYLGAVKVAQQWQEVKMKQAEAFEKLTQAANLGTGPTYQALVNTLAQQKELLRLKDEEVNGQQRKIQQLRQEEAMATSIQEKTAKRSQISAEQLKLDQMGVQKLEMQASYLEKVNKLREGYINALEESAWGGAETTMDVTNASGMALYMSGGGHSLVGTTEGGGSIAGSTIGATGLRSLSTNSGPQYSSGENRAIAAVGASPYGISVNALQNGSSAGVAAMGTTGPGYQNSAFGPMGTPGQAVAPGMNVGGVLFSSGAYMAGQSPPPGSTGIGVPAPAGNGVVGAGASAAGFGVANTEPSVTGDFIVKGNLVVNGTSPSSTTKGGGGGGGAAPPSAAGGTAPPPPASSSGGALAAPAPVSGTALAAAGNASYTPPPAGNPNIARPASSSGGGIAPAGITGFPQGSEGEALFLDEDYKQKEAIKREEKRKSSEEFFKLGGKMLGSKIIGQDSVGIGPWFFNSKEREILKERGIDASSSHKTLLDKMTSEREEYNSAPPPLLTLGSLSSGGFIPQNISNNGMAVTVHAGEIVVPANRAHMVPENVTSGLPRLSTGGVIGGLTSSSPRSFAGSSHGGGGSTNVSVTAVCPDCTRKIATTAVNSFFDA